MDSEDSPDGRNRFDRADGECRGVAAGDGAGRQRAGGYGRRRKPNKSVRGHEQGSIGCPAEHDHDSPNIFCAGAGY